MTKPSKQDRKGRILTPEELAAELPMTPAQLNGLLDYLDEHLESCRHTTPLTAQYLAREQLDPEQVLAWLGTQGGFCDCEVLSTLENIAELYAPRPAIIIPPPKVQRPPRDLQTKTGWNLAELPKPWRIGNRYDATKPLLIELGKKGGCVLKLIEKSLPKGDQSKDEYWSAIFLKRIQPCDDLPVLVVRNALPLPTHLQSVTVGGAAWSRVICWITPHAPGWYLEVHTDIRRQQGDFPQVAQLIAHLATQATP